MSGMRVYEYAKQNSLTSRQVLDELEKLDVDITNHMASISTDIQELLTESFNQETKEDSKQEKEVEKQTKRTSEKESSPQETKETSTETEQEENVVTYQGTLNVSQLAEKLNQDTNDILKNLLILGVMANKNQDLDEDTIELIASEYDIVMKKEAEEIILDETDFSRYITEDPVDQLIERPAVVTIMGHVDHGKTTLLDAVRKTKVTEGEAGGITQHIGAYQVESSGKKLTFLDTPGHEAFTSMRSRGAQATDIAVLVVAADDGVMPQTIEAINHAKAAEVPIIVAVNKMDIPTANPERLMQELTEYELIPEDWGGDTIFVPISALQGEGIEDLLEMLLLVAEMEELKANPKTNAFGTVIDAELDKGRGAVATLLVQNGTLRKGETLVVGNTHGRVRAMVNDQGRRVEEASPSTPVEITGLSAVPEAGDQFLVFADERKARQIGKSRQQKQILERRRAQSTVSLDELFEQIKQGEMKELNIIVKADVQGSAEALAASLERIEVENVTIKIIHSGVGAITESDVILASASNAIVIGFNVRPDANVQQAAEAEGVDVRLYRVIYQAIEEIEAAMKGLLDPEYEEKIIGQAEVREIFTVSRIGTIAGSYVTEGEVTRHAGVRLVRNGVVQYEGKIAALKRFKDDVREVQQNYECGITLEDYNDIKVGDVIEAFVMEEIKQE